LELVTQNRLTDNSEKRYPLDADNAAYILLLIGPTSSCI